MNETLDGTGIEYHECPECDAALEHNVILDWERAVPRAPTNYVPLVQCALCGYAAGGAYGAEIAYELLETVNINIEEATPGERIEPEAVEAINRSDGQ